MNKPSKEAFERYVEVQASGVCNMLSREVQYLAEITREEHTYIISHYDELEEEYDIHLEEY